MSGNSPVQTVEKIFALGDGSFIVLKEMRGASEQIPQDVVERNVFRMDTNGRVLWRILAPPPIYPRSPFTGIKIDANGRVEAFRWEGDQYELDVDTGVARPLVLGK